MAHRFSVGNSVCFQRSGDHKSLEGLIVSIDLKDDDLPYNIAVENKGTFWCSEDEIISIISSKGVDQMNRIEAKLDALLAHLGVKVD